MPDSQKELYNEKKEAECSAGLYIHIPFCKTKCPYCGFYSVLSASLRNEWLKALKREIILYRDRYSFFDTLYLGGGTPSLLSSNELHEIMECLYDHYRFANDTEITIESNPGDMNDEKIGLLKSLGFNRVNLGVQSLDDDDLRFLERRHSAQDALKALESLRKSGFSNIGIDLMYGLETQTIAKWKTMLEHAVHYRPEHISCYQLTIEEKTPFMIREKAGRIKLLNEEQESDFFLSTSRFLSKRGYIHYEISNFSIDEAHFSRHNRKYWNRVPYLGLGPSSHSFMGRTRWWNHRSVRKYCEELEKGMFPVEERESLTNEQVLMEMVSLGLRTRDGFDPEILGNDSKIEEALYLLKREGYLKTENNRVVPTQKGFLVADRLPLLLGV